MCAKGANRTASPHLFSGDQVRKSLDTRDKRSALRLYAARLAEIAQELETKRAGLARQDKITQSWLAGASVKRWWSGHNARGAIAPSVFQPEQNSRVTRIAPFSCITRRRRF